MVTCSTPDNKKSHGFSRFYGNGISTFDDIFRWEDFLDLGYLNV